MRKDTLTYLHISDWIYIFLSAVSILLVSLKELFLHMSSINRKITQNMKITVKKITFKCQQILNCNNSMSNRWNVIIFYVENSKLFVKRCQKFKISLWLEFFLSFFVSVKASSFSRTTYKKIGHLTTELYLLLEHTRSFIPKLPTNTVSWDVNSLKSKRRAGKLHLSLNIWGKLWSGLLSGITWSAHISESDEPFNLQRREIKKKKKAMFLTTQAVNSGYIKI